MGVPGFFFRPLHTEQINFLLINTSFVKPTIDSINETSIVLLMSLPFDCLLVPALL